MSKVLIPHWFQPGETSVDGVTNYCTVGAAAVEGDASGVARPVRDAGTFSQLSVRVLANTLTGSATYTLQKSAVDTTLLVTFASGETGVKTDSSNSAAFANTDEAALQLVTAAGGTSIIWSQFWLVFEAVVAKAVSLVGSNKASSSFITGANLEWFYTAVGGRNGSDIESQVQMRSRAAFAWSDYAVRTGVNGRTTDSTSTTRINGITGNQTVTILPTTDNSWVEDSSNSDAVVAGDNFCARVLSGSGTGTLNLEKFTSTLTSANSSDFLMSLHGSSVRIDAGLSRYFPLGGSMSGDEEPSEGNVEMPAPFGFVAKEFVTNIDRIVGNITSTHRVRKNGGNGNQVLSYAAAETGIKVDSSNRDRFVAGDTCNYSMVTAGGTNTDLRFVGLIGSAYTEVSVSHGAGVLVRKAFEESHSSNTLLASALISEVIFEDHFTEAGDTTLESHTPFIGTSWVRRGAEFLQVVAASDRVSMPGTTVASSNVIYEATPAATQRDIDVSVAVYGAPVSGGTDDPFQLFARYENDNNWYSGGFYQDINPSNCRIFKKVAGVVTEIASGSATINTGDVVTLEVRGPATATVVRLLVNSFAVLTTATQNQPTLTARGYGIGLGNNWNDPLDDANSSWVFDDFVARQYSSASELSQSHTANLTLKAVNSDRAHTADVLADRVRIHTADTFLEVPVAENVFFSDLFTTGVDQNLELHTPNIGTSWTKVGTQTFNILASSDRMRMPGAIVASSNALYRGFPDASVGEMAVQVLLRGGFEVGGSDDPFQLFARYADEDNWYSAGAYQNNHALNLRIVKAVAGVRTEIASAKFNLSQNDIVRFRVRGLASAAVCVVTVNDVEQLTSAPQNEPSLTGKGHGIGLGNNWGVVTDDANPAWIFDDYQASEFTEFIEEEFLHTADVSIKKLNTDRVHSADMLLEQVRDVVHTADSFLGGELFRTHSADTLLWAVVTPITGLGPGGIGPAYDIGAKPQATDQLHNADLFLLRFSEKAHTAEVLLRKTLTVGHTADTFLDATPIRQHSANVLVRGPHEVAHSANMLSAIPFRSHTAQVFVAATLSKTHDAHVYAVKARTATHTVDVGLVAVQTNTRTHTGNVLAGQTETIAHTASTLVEAVFSRQHQVDVLPRKSFEHSHTVETFLQSAPDVEHTADTSLKRAIDQLHTADTILGSDTAKSHGGDTALKAIGLDRTHSGDAYVILLGEETHTADVYVFRPRDLDVSVDVLVRAALDRSHSTDLALRAALDLDHETDAGVWWMKDTVHVADVIIKPYIDTMHTADISLWRSYLISNEATVKNLTPKKTVRRVL